MIPASSAIDAEYKAYLRQESYGKQGKLVGYLPGAASSAGALCPHQELVIKRDGISRRQTCRQPAMHSGWCSRHRDAHRFPKIGAERGYPALEFEYRGVGEGYTNWAYYAQICSRGHIIQDIHAILARTAKPIQKYERNVYEQQTALDGERQDYWKTLRAKIRARAKLDGGGRL